MTLILDNETYNILYNDAPNDSICKAECLEFIEDLKHVLELTEKLYADIEKRDEKLHRKYERRKHNDNAGRRKDI